jgi:hypothetical protein
MWEIRPVEPIHVPATWCLDGWPAARKQGFSTDVISLLTEAKRKSVKPLKDSRCPSPLMLKAHLGDISSSGKSACSGSLAPKLLAAALRLVWTGTQACPPSHSPDAETSVRSTYPQGLRSQSPAGV